MMTLSGVYLLCFTCVRVYAGVQATTCPESVCHFKGLPKRCHNGAARPRANRTALLRAQADRRRTRLRHVWMGEAERRVHHRVSYSDLLHYHVSSAYSPTHYLQRRSGRRLAKGKNFTTAASRQRRSRSRRGERERDFDVTGSWKVTCRSASHHLADVIGQSEHHGNCRHCVFRVRDNQPVRDALSPAVVLTRHIFLDNVTRRGRKALPQPFRQSVCNHQFVYQLRDLLYLLAQFPRRTVSHADVRQFSAELSQIFVCQQLYDDDDVNATAWA